MKGKRGFASFDKQKLKEVSRKGGQQSKGRKLTLEHRAKIAATWKARLEAKDK